MTKEYIELQLQLLKPKESDNIFLGLGGFHMEKVVISCIGKYSEETGIENVLVENEIFGPIAVKIVMNGGHYVRGKHGMNLVAESIYRPQIDQSFKLNEYSEFKNPSEEISTLQSLIYSNDTEHPLLLGSWERSKNCLNFKKILISILMLAVIKVKHFDFGLIF